MRVCPHCKKTLNPAEVDVPFGDPFEGLCEDCWSHNNYLLQVGYISLKHLARQTVVDPTSTAFEDMVTNLFAIRSEPKTASGLTKKWRSDLMGGAE